MIQISNFFKEIESYYFINEDGEVLNIKTNKFLKLYDNTHYRLRTIEGKTKVYTLKKLYKTIYNKNFCIDTIENLENEIWKEIEGAEGYFISNKARVKSCVNMNAIILEQYRTTKNYMKVNISINGKKHFKFIHRLVIEAFTGKAPSQEYQVHHQDFNSLNNFVENLIWMEPREHNKIHAERIIKGNGNNTKSEDNNKS